VFRLNEKGAQLLPPAPQASVSAMGAAGSAGNSALRAAQWDIRQGGSGVRTIRKPIAEYSS
jgi:hypothetical protein